MKTVDRFPIPDRDVWEYLVSDFLEMACFLTRDEQDVLLEALRQAGITAVAIDSEPSFSIDGRIIIVRDEMAAKETSAEAPQECWVYSPKGKRIRKYGLNTAL